MAFFAVIPRAQASWPICSAPRWGEMSAGMFPTPGPGLHTGPPRTGLVMWQPQPGMRLVKMNLQGEQAPYPTGGNSNLCALEDTKSAITKAEMEVSRQSPCQVLAGPKSRS